MKIWVRNKCLIIAFVAVTALLGCSHSGRDDCWYSYEGCSDVFPAGGGSGGGHD